MATAGPNAELSDEDFDQLERMLSRKLGGKIANLETLDGFLTALVISPELVRPTEFVPVILTGDTEDDDLVFESGKDVEQFYDVLMRYWNEINRTFRSGDVYMPYLVEDDEGNVSGNDWAKGFLAGTQLQPDAWAGIINDEERAGPFVPIWALFYEHSDDPALRPFKEPITEEKREDLIAGMIAGVKLLYDMFREEHRIAAESTTLRPSPGKVGRNDPCPCGSGKKFKKCCGRVTL